ncbi:hypothetical protein FHG87_021068 [Trinorchestia longiramus]|nr:hypothetical protein FHG87_021068 [Trinorchestia longiramus]
MEQSEASHVRRVRVPSQASDVDQYLDDLFIPVLDHQIADDFSDARSLAASIKGGSSSGSSGGPKSGSRSSLWRSQPLSDDVQPPQDDVPLWRNSLQSHNALTLSNSSSRNSLLDALLLVGEPGATPPESLLPGLDSALLLPPSLQGLADPLILSTAIKGGGAGAAEVEGAASGGGFYQQRTPTTSSVGPASPPLMSLNTLPLYSPGGLVLPGLTPQTPAVDPANLMAYQQNLQRAYIQSAVAQNIQIQQHLMAQNQALQQLLTPNLPVSEDLPHSVSVYDHTKELFVECYYFSCTP